MNRKQAIKLALAACAVAAAGSTFAQDAATEKEAIAMVKKGVAYIKAHGYEKGFAEITRRDSKEFHDRDGLLEIIRLNRVFTTYPTVEQAVQSYR